MKKVSNRLKDKPLLLKNVLIKNTFDKLDKYNNDIPRNVICKVQNSLYPSKMYILYIKGKYKTKHVANIIDYPGIFSNYKDAFFVKKCLNKLFKNIDDDKWKLSQTGYTIHTAYMNEIINTPMSQSQHADVYILKGEYTSKHPLNSNEYTIENIIGISDSRFKIKDLISQYKKNVGDFSTWAPIYDKHQDVWIEFEHKIYIKEYYMNDIMPTMYISDYDGTKHKEQFKKIMSGLSK